VLDVDALRRRFPALSARTDDGRDVVHADAPGGTQAVDLAIEAMADHLRTGTANSHAPFPDSERLDAMVDRVREQAGRFLDSEPGSIVFGPNMTTLTFHLAHALAREVDAEANIVCTRLDHDANVAPWRLLAERTGAEVRYVPIDDEARLEAGALERLVDEHTALVTLPGASNAFGTRVDPAPFVVAARAVGALVFVDAVHLAPHAPLRRRGWDVDVVACSPYKFFGPHSGMLAIDPALLERLRPDKVRPSPDEGPDRWQTGTASFEAIAGIGGALGYHETLDWGDVQAHERALAERFLAGVHARDHVRLHGPDAVDGRTPTFAVTVDGHTPDAVATHLGRRGVNVYAGHYYALEPMAAMGLLEHGGAVRVGFVHYHRERDVDRVLEVLDELR
jgi:cysteine desulfurase family protein (TIGR01976 family)